jgi:hypothetical protein
MSVAEIKYDTYHTTNQRNVVYVHVGFTPPLVEQVGLVQSNLNEAIKIRNALFVSLAALSPQRGSEESNRRYGVVFTLEHLTAAPDRQKIEYVLSQFTNSVTNMAS